MTTGIPPLSVEHWLDSLATCPVNVDLIELVVNTRPDAVREIVYWAAVTRQRHNAATQAARAYLALEDRPAHRTGFWEGVLAVTEPEGEL